MSSYDLLLMHAFNASFFCFSNNISCDIKYTFDRFSIKLYLLFIFNILVESKFYLYLTNKFKFSMTLLFLFCSFSFTNPVIYILDKGVINGINSFVIMHEKISPNILLLLLFSLKFSNLKLKKLFINPIESLSSYFISNIVIVVFDAIEFNSTKVI